MQSAAVSIVTVSPLAMVTSSAAPGTTPPAQVAGALQIPPPVPLDEMGVALATEANESDKAINKSAAR